MEPIICDACCQPTVAHDVVNYGSMGGGYRQLCGRCFNEAAASRLGLQEFEHVSFEPVCMVDARGAQHEFRFRSRLFGPGVALDAFELRDGCPAGYRFQVIGEPQGDHWSCWAGLSARCAGLWHSPISMTLTMGRT